MAINSGNSQHLPCILRSLRDVEGLSREKRWSTIARQAAGKAGENRPIGKIAFQITGVSDLFLRA